MDAVSHLIFGRALAAIAPRPTAPVPHAPATRGLTAATVIASIVPDADAVLMPFGWDRYLLWHQRGTHALIGTLADAIVFALLLWALLAMWQWPRAPRTSRHSRRAESGTTDQATDLSGDAHITSSGIAMASSGGRVPLSDGVGVESLSPMPGRGQGKGHSPARLTHLVLAAWLGCLGHIVLDLISGGTIRLFSPFSIVPYGVPWMAMADPLIAVPLAIFLIASWRWPARERVARFAWITLIVLATLVGIKEVSRRAAIAVYARASEGRPDIQSPAIESAWASLTRWFAFDRTSAPARLRVFEVDAWRGTVRPLFSREVSPQSNGGDAALIQASEQLETVRHLHTLFDLTFAEIRPHAADNRLVDVLWSDIRFCWPTNCALWFGGTFDSSTGALREQVVLVGTLRQTRPP